MQGAGHPAQHQGCVCFVLNVSFSDAHRPKYQLIRNGGEPLSKCFRAVLDEISVPVHALGPI